MVGKRKYFPHSYLGILHSFTHGINLNFELACIKSSMKKSQSRNKSWHFLISDTEDKTTFAVPSFLSGELGILSSPGFALLLKA